MPAPSETGLLAPRKEPSPQCSAPLELLQGSSALGSSSLMAFCKGCSVCHCCAACIISLWSLVLYFVGFLKCAVWFCCCSLFFCNLCIILYYCEALRRGIKLKATSSQPQPNPGKPDHHLTAYVPLQQCMMQPQWAHCWNDVHLYAAFVTNVWSTEALDWSPYLWCTFCRKRGKFCRSFRMLSQLQC